MAQFIVGGDSMAHRVGDYLCVGGVLAMICLGAMGCGKSQTATYLGNKQFSPELVARARKILRGPVVEAWGEFRGQLTYLGLELSMVALLASWRENQIWFRPKAGTSAEIGVIRGRDQA